MKSRTVKKISNFITYIIILGVVGIVFGIIMIFTNGFTTSFRTFYVVHEDKVYIDSGEDLLLHKDIDYVFKPRYVFSVINKDMSKDYIVKIIPNITDEIDFDFTVDDEVYSFSAFEDFTEYFDIKVYDDYFTLNVPNSIDSLLQLMYPDTDIVIPELSNKLDYFTLIVTSYNGESVVKFNFNIYVEVEGVILDENVVVF